MQPFLSKKSRIKLKILAWYQIVGGIAGVLITIWLVAHLEQIKVSLLPFIVLALSLYFFSIYSGRLLLTDKYLLGFRLSIINQIIQIPQFIVFGYAFWYVSGSMVTLGVDLDHSATLIFDFDIASTYQISIHSSDTTSRVAINLIAIYVVYFIEKLIVSIKNEKIAYEERLTAEAAQSSLEDI